MLGWKKIAQNQCARQCRSAKHLGAAATLTSQIQTQKYGSTAWHHAAGRPLSGQPNMAAAACRKIKRALCSKKCRALTPAHLWPALAFGCLALRCWNLPAKSRRRNISARLYAVKFAGVRAILSPARVRIWLACKPKPKTKATIIWSMAKKSGHHTPTSATGFSASCAPIQASNMTAFRFC